MEYRKINNSHDLFFKESMERGEIAQDLARIFLDPAITTTIDFTTFEIVKDVWVDTELSEHFADIVYRARNKNTNDYVYLLFEHKSFTDKKTALQNLRYMDQLWDLIEKQTHASKLPPVISIIVYHGDKPWNIENSTKSQIEISNGIDCYIPDYRSVIIDLTKIDTDGIEGTIEVKAFLCALKYSRKQNVMEKISGIIKMLNHQAEGDKGYLSVVLKYIGAVLPVDKREEYSDIIRNAADQGDSRMKTVADSFREEGFIKGKKEGKAEGKMEDQLEIAERMVAKGMDVNEIREITKLTIEQVEELIRKLKKKM